MTPDDQYVVNPTTVPTSTYWFTCFCSHPSDGRGEYSEEIDVAYTGRGRPSMAAVRRVAQARLDADYAPGMKVRRVRRNFGMVL